LKKVLSGILICAFIPALLPFAGIGCGDSEHKNNQVKGEFSIYLLTPLRHEITQLGELDRCPEVTQSLSKLELQDKPLLSVDDIDFYDFSSHCIYLKEERAVHISNIISGLFPTSSDTPFVVVANGERCYLGYFLSMLSSWLPMTPIIEGPIEVGLYPKDVIHIEQGFTSDRSFKDVRSDERIKNALLESNKLSPGLQVELNEVKIASRSDTTTLSYMFTITDEDDNALYVPDPDKMGSSLFHYYTNGVYLINPNNPTASIGAENGTSNGPEPYDSWNVEWFTKLDSHQSMRRSVMQGGYPNIQSGTYNCGFIYSGPTNIEKSKRLLPDGRIWIGEVRSTSLTVTIE